MEILRKLLLTYVIPAIGLFGLFMLITVVLGQPAGFWFVGGTIALSGWAGLFQSAEGKR